MLFLLQSQLTAQLLSSGREEVFSVCVCVCVYWMTAKTDSDRVCVYVKIEVVYRSNTQHTNHLTNLSALQSFSINSTTMNQIIGFLMRQPLCCPRASQSSHHNSHVTTLHGQMCAYRTEHWCVIYSLLSSGFGLSTDRCMRLQGLAIFQPQMHWWGLVLMLVPPKCVLGWMSGLSAGQSDTNLC